MLTWACALGILGLSAPTSCSSTFYYSKNPYQKSEECNLCFEKDCMTLDQARCEYYAEADSLLLKDNDDLEPVDAPKGNEVDDLIYDLVDKATRLSTNMECIPYISRYTSCNKDNVCLGCKNCVCNPGGKWTCTIMQPCHNQQPSLNIDHSVLVNIMKALTDTGHPRKTKRSVTDNPPEIRKDVTDTPSTNTSEQLSKWLYEVKPQNIQETSPNETSTDFTVTVQDNGTVTEKTTENDPGSTVSGLTTMEVVTEASTNGGIDYVAFEVLRNIDVDTKSYSRRKPLDNKQDNQTFNIDYMIIDEDNDNFEYMMNLMEDYNDITESTTGGANQIMIDLLKTAENLGANMNVTADHINNINYNKSEKPNIFENSNDIIEYNALNIMKRDVTDQEKITVLNAVPTVTIIVNTTNTTNNNNTEETIDFKENILIPVNNIITDKINELKNLQKIKEDLLKFVKSDGEQTKDVRKENNTSETYFSIYNVALATGLDVNLRRANTNMYDKYLLKLKRDILEVIRDIKGLQRHKVSELPDDIKFLMYALNRYVYNNGLIDNLKRIKLKRKKGFRRHMEQTSGRCDFISFKACLVSVLEVIDKDMPKSNSLAPLSPASRKIIKHLIQSYYAGEFAMPGLGHDPHYNMKNDLKNIDRNWQEITANTKNNSPSDNLYKMKLLHCTFTLDISKMNDALSIIEFSHRRMLSSLNNISEDTLDIINAELSANNKKIQMIIRNYKQKPKLQTIKPQAEMNETTTKLNDPTETRRKNSHSFMKHIRNLFKTLKTDTAHRNISKSEIVKLPDKSKLDEISAKRYDEYEETMKKWQKNLKVAPRNKRSIFYQFRTNIKDIIPDYLRHKVNPRINESKKNATADATRKKRQERRALKRERLKASRKARKTTTSTITIDSN